MDPRVSNLISECIPTPPPGTASLPTEMLAFDPNIRVCLVSEDYGDTWTSTDLDR